MSYPHTGNEVFVSFSLSNTMFSGLGKGTITRKIPSLLESMKLYGGIIMSYPHTGNEVFVSFSLSNTMFSGLGKGTITREDVSADYLKELFNKYGVVVSAKPEQRKLLERVNTIYDLNLDIPENLKIIQLSEKNRRLVLISVQGLRRQNGSLLPEYTEEEFQEATFSFVKYYVQSRHYDELVAENEKLKKDLNAEIAWRTRVSDI